MKAPIRVVTEEEFQKWLKPRQEKNAAPATSSSAPVAALTHP
jgi:heme/copper-type cytochrome/quinol oxidase subunit 2